MSVQGNREEDIVELLELLPVRIAEEIRSICASYRGFSKRLSELRLCAEGICSLVLDGKRYPLFRGLSHAEAEELLIRIAEGSLYAHREELCHGYISLPRGIRVGIGGRAVYDGEEVRGVSEISTLVFRLPTGECGYTEELYRRWTEDSGGMLLIAPPSAGKTTALRSLSRRIGSGRNARAVIVVDERLEFDALDYRGTLVTILRGYKRGAGLELALRTMSAEVLVVDELVSSSDTGAMLPVVGSGVRLLASLHGDSCEGAYKREQTRRLLELGAFSSLVSLDREGSHFYIKEVRAC